MSGPHVALHGGVSLLERAITYTLGGLTTVRPADLSRPTPCPDWDLRDLLAHLDDGLRALAEAAEEGRVHPPGAPQRGSATPEAVRRDAYRALGGWIRAAGNPGILLGTGTLTAALLTASGAVEVAAHGWDLSRACGRNRPIPAALAGELLELAPLLITEIDRPGRFAPAVPAPPGSGPGDRLVAFLGRPVVDSPAPLLP